MTKQMSPQEYVQRWKWLKAQVNLVQDRTLRNAMMAEFRKRALRDWGFDPENGQTKTESVVLNDWEKDFLQDIQDSRVFGFNVRQEKQKKEAKEAKARMLDFISKGGCLKDIPEDVRTDTIVKLYYDCLNEYGDQLMEEADRFIGENQ